jgi:hypothetical protein
VKKIRGVDPDSEYGFWAKKKKIMKKKHVFFEQNSSTLLY